MYKTDAIVRFMQNHYTDEKLAALLAHVEDGKLMYMSCCCFIGVATADHALRGETLTVDMWPGSQPHYRKAKDGFYGAEEVELDYFKLGKDDAERRQNLIPLIKQEMARREALRNANDSNTGCTSTQEETQDRPTTALLAVR